MGFPEAARAGGQSISLGAPSSGVRGWLRGPGQDTRLPVPQPLHLENGGNYCCSERVLRGCWRAVGAPKQQLPPFNHPWRTSQAEPPCWGLGDTSRDLSVGSGIETMSHDELLKHLGILS